MPKIYFVSGKIEDVDIDEAEFDRLILRMQSSGIRFTRLKNGSVVPLNSNTMELITREGLAPRKPTVVKIEESIPSIEETIKSIEEENEPSPMDRERAALEEIVAKSNCTHAGKLTVQKLEGKKGTRYFHVCSFCGWKSKFVKAEDLTETDKELAAIYQES